MIHRRIRGQVGGVCALELGARAFVVAAAAALSAGGCGQASKGGAGRGGPPAPGELAESAAARRVVGEVRQGFVLAHHEAPDEHKFLWDELTEELTRADDPALRDAQATSFTRRPDGRLAPVVRRERARVSLSPWADGATAVASVDSPVAIEVSLQGARAREAEVAGGYLVYRDALGEGRHLIHRAGEDGTEDHVLFPQRPPSEELVYSVDVTRVPGVRVVPGADAVEFLSDDGTPRLHMAPPHLVDARGETIRARVGVSGCSFDADPHAPWGRPVTGPRSPACEVRVSWSGLGAVYPVLVDPAWSQTGVPLVARAWHQMVLLDDGTAMSFGGFVPPGLTAVASMEFWNNGVWAAGASMNVARAAFQGRKLDNGDVIAVGGGTTTDRWSKASATWIVDPGSAMAAAHGAYFGTTKLKNGKLLAVSNSNGGGAYSANAEIYDPVARTWTPVASMNHARGFLQNQVLGLPDGRAYVIGGSGPDGGVTEFYDPVMNTWADGPPLVQGNGRPLGVALALADGRIFMSGVVQTVETLDLTATTPAWKVSSPSPQAAVHQEHTAIQLLNGRVLLHGSDQATKPESQTWDPFYDIWKIESGITKVSDFPASVRFADARVLVTGGSVVADNTSNNSPIAWIFGCTIPADCGGTLPFCEVATGKCVACLSDNGGAKQACPDPMYPFCDATGACFPCTPGDLSHCSASAVACDAVTHSCAPCNGNHGSGASAECPLLAKPFCNGVTGQCDASCTADVQCGPGQFCDDITPTGACAPKIAGGKKTPGGKCDATIGARVCAAGACDAVDQVCGVDLGHGTCATSAQCNAGVCATSGMNKGKCEACDKDGDCPAGQVCGATNACSECAAGKTASCVAPKALCDTSTGSCVGCLSSADCAAPSKPLCDPKSQQCVACAGDAGQAGNACPPDAPVCLPSGACRKCAADADCAGSGHAGPVCNPLTGACGTLCTTDQNCPGKWCDNPGASPAGGMCTPLVANGQMLPASQPIKGTCTADAGARVCAAGVCDPATNLCGLSNGEGPCTAATATLVCDSGVCDGKDGKCGYGNGEGPCTAANAAAVCRSSVCDGACGYLDGHGPCTTAAQCVSAICGPNGLCGATMGTGGSGGSGGSGESAGAAGASAQGGMAGLAGAGGSGGGTGGMPGAAGAAGGKAGAAGVPGAGGSGGGAAGKAGMPAAAGSGGSAAGATGSGGIAGAAGAAAGGPAAAPGDTAAAAQSGGCGCATVGGEGAGRERMRLVGLLLALTTLRTRRRPSASPRGARTPSAAAASDS